MMLMNKQPRLQPRERPSARPDFDPKMAELARRGAYLYHPPLNADQQRRVGQMSLTDGLPVIREVPETPDAA